MRNQNEFDVCRRYGVQESAPEADHIFGFGLGDSDGPLHGLRHEAVGDTCGWYIWRGEYSSDKDFFSPLHIKHVIKKCPEATPYLALPPGWRFLVKDKYEDVWFDESLLNEEYKS